MPHRIQQAIQRRRSTDRGSPDVVDVQDLILAHIEDLEKRMRRLEHGYYIGIGAILLLEFFMNFLHKVAV
jgi:hypothetical protein